MTISPLLVFLFYSNFFTHPPPNLLTEQLLWGPRTIFCMCSCGGSSYNWKQGRRGLCSDTTKRFVNGHLACLSGPGLDILVGHVKNECFEYVFHYTVFEICQYRKEMIIIELVYFQEIFKI